MPEARLGAEARAASLSKRRARRESRSARSALSAQRTLSTAATADCRCNSRPAAAVRKLPVVLRRARARRAPAGTGPRSGISGAVRNLMRCTCCVCVASTASLPCRVVCRRSCPARTTDTGCRSWLAPCLGAGGANGQPTDSQRTAIPESRCLIVSVLFRSRRCACASLCLCPAFCLWLHVGSGRRLCRPRRSARQPTGAPSALCRPPTLFCR